MFLDNLSTNFIAIGAATTLPMINPKIVCQWLTPNKVKKVKTLAKVTKNSVRLTVPMMYFGVRKLLINVVVTIGPQPPPPKESRNPPVPARPFYFMIQLMIS